jgi:hypothetical protein
MQVGRVGVGMFCFLVHVLNTARVLVGFLGPWGPFCIMGYGRDGGGTGERVVVYNMCISLL